MMANEDLTLYLLQTVRAQTITFPTFDDITYPWGPTGGTGSFNSKIIDWKDNGRINPLEWSLSITFSRVF